MDIEEIEKHIRTAEVRLSIYLRKIEYYTDLGWTGMIHWYSNLIHDAEDQVHELKESLLKAKQHGQC